MHDAINPQSRQAIDPGPRPSAKLALPKSLGEAAALRGYAFFREKPGDGLDYGVIWNNLPFLWQGMQLTLLLTALAMAGGIVLRTLLALARMSSLRPLSYAAAGYINFFRSLPLILVIFWFYSLVPLVLGRPVGGFYSVLIAFTLFEAACYAEIIRAGISSVQRGQIAAAIALGMTYYQSRRYIVLPQAFRAMTPILLTQAISSALGRDR